VIAAPTPRTVPAGTSRLAFGIHAGTIDDLPISSVISRLTIQERYFTAREAGYVLIQGGDDDLALRAGLERAGMGRVVHAGETARLAEEAKARGCGSVTLHVGTGFESDSEADALVVDILDASSTHDIPLYIETHRATITQDPWRTLRLVERHPNMRFTGDFSHWYTGVELVYGDLGTKLDALQPVFDRVRFVHGRIGTPCSIQVDVGDGKSQPYVTDFSEIWSRVFEAFLRNAEEDEPIVFVPELLSPLNYYALRVRTPAGELVEAGDRWEQAFALCDIAAEAFTAAQGRIR
jgi:hypothetical protein